MNQRITRALRAVVMVALAAASFCATAEAGDKKGVRVLVPGDNYCGFGNRGGSPKNARDEACRAHDQDYSRLKSKGVNPYRLTGGNKDVIRADLRLADRARRARRAANDSRDKAKSLLVESAMRAKAASNAHRYVKKQIRRKVCEQLLKLGKRK